MEEEEKVEKVKNKEEGQGESKEKLSMGEYMNVFKKDKRLGNKGNLKRAWRVSRVGIVGTPLFRLFLFGFFMVLPLLTILLFSVVAMVLLSGGVTAIIALDEDYTDETRAPIGGSLDGDGESGGSGSGLHVPDNIKGKLLFPGGVSRITSLRGPRGSGYHNGVDMGRKLGGPDHPPITPIYPGEVVLVQDYGSSGWGKTLVVEHDVDGETMYSRYAHFHTTHAKKGDKVGYHTVLGDMGNTGGSDGIHLHLEIYTSGYTVGGTHTEHSLDALDVLVCDKNGGAAKVLKSNIDRCVDYRNSVVN